MFASVLDPVINVLDPADISARIRQLLLALAGCARQLMLLDDLGLLALAFLVTCDLVDALIRRNCERVGKPRAWAQPGRPWAS